MALSVSSFTPVADWFSSVSPRNLSASTSWSAGDIIVVGGASETAANLIGTPTVSGLTFAQQAAQTTGGAAESTAYIWTATAGSSGSGTIQITRTAGGAMYGACAWVITGSPTGVANATANLTEGAISRTVNDGSVVIYILGDWSANNTDQTPATGSGSATERVDTTNTSNYAINAYDWVGTSAGTFGFGVSSYTGLQVAHAVIEVLAPAGPVAIGNSLKRWAY